MGHKTGALFLVDLDKHLTKDAKENYLKDSSLLTCKSGYDMIPDFTTHLNDTLSPEKKEELYIHPKWVSAKKKGALKSERSKSLILDESCTTSTAVEKFRASRKRYAIFFLHCNILKIGDKGKPDYHAWLLFVDRTDAVAVLLNPLNAEVKTLPAVPSDMLKRLKSISGGTLQHNVYTGLQGQAESNCIARCVKFAYALVSRPDLQWTGESFLKKLSPPYNPKMNKRR